MDVFKLPPEVLRVVFSKLIWADALSARAACCTWAAVVTPLMTQLRVPLVAVAGAQADTQPAAAAHISSPCEQLSAALDKLTGVQAVTLLLAGTTTGADLQQALQIVGTKANITSVTISEVGGPHAYESSLHLHHLIHVRTLTLERVSWALEDIWQQLAALEAAARAAGSNAGTAAAPNCNTADISDSSSRQQLASCSTGAHAEHKSLSGSSSGCALHTLVISPSRKLHVLTGEFVVTCDVLPEQLPSSLRHLTTPLPGQYNRSGDVVCPLYVSHREYLQQLAVRLPHLQSLTLVGERGCWAAEALQEFKHLRELRCKLWGLSGRSLFDAVDDDLEDDTPALQLASALVQLERLELVSQLPLQHFGHRPPLPLYWGNTTFALPWLRGLQQLQHLAGPLVYAAQDVRACQGQLRSLDCCVGQPSQQIITQVASVGAALTSLSLYQQGGSTLFSNRQEARLSRSHLQPPGGPWAPYKAMGLLGGMANLVKLSVVLDSSNLELPVAWGQMPALRCLKLQNVCVGRGAAWAVDNRGRVRAQATAEGAAAEAEAEQQSGGGAGGQEEQPPLCPHLCTRLHLQDLPCEQLHELELGCYDIILDTWAAAASGPAAAAGAAAAVGSNHATAAATAPPAAALTAGFAACSLHERAGAHEQGDTAHVRGGSSGGGTITSSNGGADSGSSISGNGASSASASSMECSGSLRTVQPGMLSQLWLLSLCDCVLLVPAQHSSGSSSPSTSAAAAATAALPSFVKAGLPSLLSLLVDPVSNMSALRAFRLHSVTLCWDDILCLGSQQLGQLHELHIQVATYCTHKGQPSAAGGMLSPGASQLLPPPPQQQQQQEQCCASGTAAARPHDSLTQALQAAVAAGGLRDLRRLFLDVQEQQAEGGQGRWPGLSLLQPCCGLSRLQELRLMVALPCCDLLPPLPLELCSCSSGSMPGLLLPLEPLVRTVPACKGPWEQLTQLQHLQKLRVNLAFSWRHNELYGEAAEVPVGRCSSCSKEVGHSSLQQWLELVAAQALPGCRLGTQLVADDGLGAYGARY